MSQWIPLAGVRIDAGTQIRVRLNRPTIDSYRDLLIERAQDASQQAGDGNFLEYFQTPFPPVKAYQVGDELLLVDGFHRHEAYRQANIPVIWGEVIEGTFREAKLAAIGANREHGLPRTNADKRRAVEELLHDEEWSRWSNNEIAQAAGVSRELVRQIRSIMQPLQDAARMVRRDGQEYVQDTTGQQEAARQRFLEQIREEYPDLAERVENGDMTIPQARIAITQRQAAPTPQAEENPRGSISEDDYTDEEWLGSLPTFRVLMDMDRAERFRDDALSWRTLDQRGAFDRFKQEVSRARLSSAGTPFASLMQQLCAVSHPINWELCSECSGDCCEKCGYAGYVIPAKSKEELV